MGLEIERKFLVVGEEWRSASRAPRHIRQGYIMRGPETIVRVRISGDHGFLTIKGAGPGLVRSEFEYAIPRDDAEQLLSSACAGRFVNKVRHQIEWDGLAWVVDEFQGDLAGLVMAEIELYATDQDITLPPWVGKEVTDDARYRNDQLVSLTSKP